MPSVASLIRTPSVPSLVGLILANVVPLVGVAFFGWDLFEVMWLYWAENGVIGVFALLRILTAGGKHWLNGLINVPLGAFFVVHYGVFWFVHGAFVYALFGDGSREVSLGDLGAAFDGLPVEGLIPLVLSHGASFVMNYLVAGEYRATSGPTEMAKPYGRVVLLHVVILLGGWLALVAGGGVIALALLVIGKTAMDLAVHVKGHQIRLARLSQEEEGAALPTTPPRRGAAGTARA